MKVLMLNGSPRKNGNTAAALSEMERIFAAEGIETEIIQVGDQPVRGCAPAAAAAERADAFLTTS